MSCLGKQDICRKSYHWSTDMRVCTCQARMHNVVFQSDLDLSRLLQLLTIPDIIGLCRR